MKTNKCCELYNGTVDITNSCIFCKTYINVRDDDMFLGFANLDLKQIRRWAENIAGQWNGDNPGSQEERSHQATDIMEKVDELIELINGMENL